MYALMAFAGAGRTVLIATCLSVGVFTGTWARAQPAFASDQAASPAAPAQGPPPSIPAGGAELSKTDLESCRAHRVTGLPGSHHFGSDFIEVVATDPARNPNSPETLWALTADLSSKVPFRSRAMYISSSSDGGSTWTEVARIDSRYFDARIGEGLRNGLLVSHGAADFLVTTQRGAFQVIPQPRASDPVVRPIPGPRECMCRRAASGFRSMSGTPT
jgi:hypothetical protein